MLAVAILVVTAAYCFYRYLQPSSYPPGPSYLEIGMILWRSRTWSVRELSRKYGSLYTIWLGPTPLVIASSREVTKQLFADHDKYRDSVWYPYLSEVAFGSGVKSILWNEASDSWRQLKGLMTKSLAKSLNEATFGQRTNMAVDQAFDHIKATHGERPFDFDDYCFFILSSLISDWMFQEPYGSPDNADFRRLDAMANEATAHVDMFAAGGLVPPLKYVMRYTGIEGAVSRVMGALHATALRQFRDSDTRLLDEDKPNTLSHIMIQLRRILRVTKNESSWDQLTDENVAGNLG
ncbi:hypothetical protein HDE_01896 [Halotydeus destructor]|nr:hypothetical protein HDE_01896 [Halotydeus destructor]